MHQIERPSVTIFLQKGWVIWLIRWQIQKRGVIWHEIAQNPGNFNTYLISLENFDRKSNNWGSLGVKNCKKGRHSVKKKKRCRKGGLLSGGWYIPANGSQPCTQRNIFGSHWLLNVQTSVARVNMNFSENKYHTLQILLVSTEALFHKLLHHSHASPSSPSLLRLAPPPPQKKKNQRLLPIYTLTSFW